MKIQCLVGHETDNVKLLIHGVIGNINMNVCQKCGVTWLDKSELIKTGINKAPFTPKKRIEKNV